MKKKNDKARIEKLEQDIKQLAEIVIFKYKYDKYIN